MPLWKPLSVAISAVVATAVLTGCGQNVEGPDAAVTRDLPGAALAPPASSMIDAAKLGQTDQIREMLASGSDVDSAEPDGTTPLMWAIQNRHTDSALALLEAGADVFAVNRRGITAIYLAARAGNSAVTRELLARGADANTRLPEGETVLMTAAKTGNPEVIAALLEGAGTDLGGLENRADPNAIESWHGQTALMWAAANGHVEAMRLLIEAGADVDARSQRIDAPEIPEDRRQGGFVYPSIPMGGLSPLHFAARQGQLEAVQVLIDAGANLDIVDERGSNAMVLATLNGHLDIAGLLLEAGADPNVADEYGRTVLFVATDLNTIDINPRPAPKLTSRSSPVDIAKLALEKGADPDIPLKSLLPAYLAQGATHNPILSEGATAFLRACMSGDLELVEMLLGAGADPLVTTAEREPMYMNGADRPMPGQTSALMAAAGVGWRTDISRGRDEDAIEVIAKLLELGADINAANQQGYTPLHGATLRGSTAIIRYLVDNGADLAARTADGWLPLDIALGQPEERIPYNEETATLLRELTPVELVQAARESDAG